MKPTELRNRQIEELEAELAQPLRHFRSAMIDAAERQMVERAGADTRVTARPHALRAVRLVWAPALLVLLLGVSLGLFRLSHNRHAVSAVMHKVTAPPANSAQNIDDSALMSEIDQDLSEDTPESLAPLEVMSASTTHETNNKVEGNNRVQE